MQPLIDTHSHIDLEIFADDLYEVLERSRAVGIVGQVLPGVSQQGWKRIIRLCSTEKDLYPALGLHPMYLHPYAEEDLSLLRTHALNGKIVAIGEIGLDYFAQNVDRATQQELFKAQLEIAMESRLPVLLHVRKAHDQVQKILRNMRFGHGGIVHAFSGSLQQAERYMELGFLLSICGTITYDRATKIRSVAAQLPLDSIVLETDSPDIPPKTYHGQRNSPEYLPEILCSLAQLRNESMEDIARQTTLNARAVLNTVALG